MTNVRLRVVEAMRITGREIVVVIALSISGDPVGDCTGLKVHSETEWDEWHIEALVGFDVRPLAGANEHRLVFRAAGTAREIVSGEVFTTEPKPSLYAA